MTYIDLVASFVTLVLVILTEWCLIPLWWLRLWIIRMRFIQWGYEFVLQQCIVNQIDWFTQRRILSLGMYSPWVSQLIPRCLVIRRRLLNLFRCFYVISEIECFLSRLGSYVVNNSIMYNFSFFTHILRFVFARGGSLSCVLLKGEFTFLDH